MRFSYFLNSNFSHLIGPLKDIQNNLEYFDYFPDTFDGRINLIQTLKDEYSKRKNTFLSSSAAHADTLASCLEKLDLDNDFSSLFLMVSGKTLTNEENSPDILAHINKLIYKLNFLKYVEEFKDLRNSKIIFKHLANTLLTQDKNSFNHLIECLYSEKHTKNLNVQEYPSLQNTSCMKLKLLLTQFLKDDFLLSPAFRYLEEKNPEEARIMAISDNPSSMFKKNSSNRLHNEPLELTCREEAGASIINHL